MGHVSVSSSRQETSSTNLCAAIASCGRPTGDGTNICRVASAATAQELNTLRPRFFPKALEGASRELDGFHCIWELRQTGKAGSCVSGPERRRLRGNRNTDGLAHLPSDGQDAIRLLLTIHAHDSSACVHHGSRA